MTGSDRKNKDFKLIVITGGVLSGIGKGVLAASIGSLLKQDFKIIPVKCDGYLNADPGTMNPVEHGEVFVLDDGGEVDMDFGHYERFMNVNAKKSWNLTMGKIYQKILDNERNGKYLGKTVQLIPHATDEIKRQLYKILSKEKADMGLVEIGGTVGDIENELFIEAVRQIRWELDGNHILFIHLAYVPFIYGSNEYKSKPIQNSVKLLNQKGIYPDILVARSEDKLSDSFKEKIALHCGIANERVINTINVPDINFLPYILEEQKVTSIIRKKLTLSKVASLKNKSIFSKKLKSYKVIIAGKYTDLEDSYASIKEALKHSAYSLKINVELSYLNTSKLKLNESNGLIKPGVGVIIPGGFGERGIEGKIEVIRYVRENKIPFLGICLGMQLAVIEFARHVCEMFKANSTEIVKDGLEYPVIDLLPEQKELTKKGATMRLGGQDVLIKSNTLARSIYGKKIVRERFRHRYEVNHTYIERLEKAGLIFSGSTPDQKIKQVLEIKEHPFFLGCQFHPELISRIDNPSPIFTFFLKAIKDLKG